jgi:hypothetical protein
MSYIVENINCKQDYLSVDLHNSNLYIMRNNSKNIITSQNYLLLQDSNLRIRSMVYPLDLDIITASKLSLNYINK